MLPLNACDELDLFMLNLNPMARITNDFCFRFFLAMILIILMHFANLVVEATINDGGGFSVDLIHRDSPNSPLYNPSETPLQRFNKAFQRGFSRLNKLQMASTPLINFPEAAEPSISSDNGQYLMKLSIGTPAVDVYAIVDTGSDLFWTQCQPCEQCYKQNNPIYDPAKSSTFQSLGCQSQQCHLLDTVSCSSQQKCDYTYGYGSNALTKGVLATETLTFPGAAFGNIVFGCGHNNTGGFNENEMGLVGLGGRDLSLVSQVGSRLGVHMFSYCLVPFGTNPSIKSKVKFGKDSEVLGSGVVSTPLVSKDDKTYYFVTLEGLSVGSKFISYNSSQAVSKGNVFIDSGVPPTLLPKGFYSQVEQEVRNAIKLTPFQDPQMGSQLCYKSQNVNDIGAPALTAHFDGGADVPLVATSIFIPPPLEGVFCFAMQPVDGDGGIFGNFAQSNLLIGFDLDGQKVSFKPTDCTTQP